MDNQEHRIIQNSQPQTGSLAPNIPNPLVGDIKFKNDFGETPIGLAHFTKDQGAIAILSLAGAFVGAALGGLPAAGVILLAMMNDIKYAGKAEVPPKAPDDVIDVPTHAIEDTRSTTQPQEPVVSDGIPKASPPVTPLPIQSPTTSHKWIDNFIRQTALIWGNQGSGKSWMARYITKRKKDEGYRVIVLDPDSNRSEWQGVESYHDFEEIASFLAWYVEELKERYKAFNASTMTEDAWRASLWAEGKAIAVLCEEVTTYVDLIEDKELLTQFFRLGLTKSRKQEMPLTFVSHNNTQSALGGIKGLANLIDKMLQLELKTDIDPETLQPTSSGKGAVKLDGSNQWVPVTLPKLERKITNFGEPHSPAVKQSATVIEPTAEIDTAGDIRERLEALIKVTPQSKVLPQSESAMKVLEIIQSATKHPISFESIRKSRKWEGNSPDKATLLAALNELSSEWIRGNEEEGYYLLD